MDDETALDDLDIVVELAVDRVVLEQVRERLGVSQVVDRHDLQRRVVLPWRERRGARCVRTR